MHKITLTDRVRKLTSSIVVPMGHRLKDLGVHPDALTILGLIIVGIGAIPLSQGAFLIAWGVLLAGLPIDALDGATARAYGNLRPFGAFLDSTLDRYADAIIFGALAYYYADVHNMQMVLAALVALHGSLTVSYARARAEGLGLDNRGGWLSRLERVVIILVSLFLTIIDKRAIDVGVIGLAVGTQITCIQRIIYVSRNAKPLKDA